MVYHIGIVLENLRDIEWENHWEQSLEMRKFLLKGYQEGMLLESFRGHEWDRHRKQELDIREAPTMAYHMIF